ncbi:MAG: EAL domain-containing protein [Sphingopyxis sp.]|nr:EAL domain-containing protein [Sphingopyxis sp.]
MQPLALVLVLIVATAAAGIWWTTSKSNEVALAHQLDTTRLALARSADQLAYEQQSIATWDQLVNEVARPHVRRSWLDVEIGNWLEEVFGHDMTFILDSDGRPLYGHVAGRHHPLSIFERLQPALEPLIHEARVRGGDVVRDHGGRPSVLTRPDTIYAVDAIRLEGKPAAASAMFIGEGSSSRSARPIIVSIRFLDTAYLRQVSAWGRIEGLRFAETPIARPSEAMVELKDRRGASIGYYFWKPQLPGNEILNILGPFAVLLMLALAAIMAYLVRSLWRSGRKLAISVVDLRASEAQAQHLAFHDVLTGLPNRALFNDRLDQALARMRRGHPFAVLTIDLDRFKLVNDTLGHAAGDLLIRAFATRLSALVRDADTVARFGGDEFAVLVCDTERRIDIERLAERILRMPQEPFDLLGQKMFVNLSIGIAFAPEAGCDRSEILRKADIALYEAKADGKNCFRIFTSSMDASVQTRADIENELRRALAVGGEIEVYYQPEVGRDGRTILGLEALLRWHHPLRGSIAPEHFISIAEETGLIDDLDELVLKASCAMASRHPEIFIAVNLSAVQFRHHGLAEKIIEMARSNACNPYQIELEITETVLIEEDESARSILDRLRCAGFRIALDDFGTGYSSLSYLRQFKVDKIKIDRSFIQNIGHDHEAAAIVTSMVTLGHAMGLIVTAEGVESFDQMRLLLDAGCNELQGYLFSRPVPEGAVAALLAERGSAARKVA